MDEAKRKRLMEFLGEQFHDVEISFNDGQASKCSCGARGCIARFECEKNNRTFDTLPEMMDLCQQLSKIGKWAEFYRFATIGNLPAWDGDSISLQAFITYRLFCLSGEGYEDRCEMVADFLQQYENEGGYNGTDSPAR